MNGKWFVWDTEAYDGKGAKLTPLAQHLYDIFRHGKEKDIEAKYGRNSYVWMLPMGSLLPQDKLHEFVEKTIGASYNVNVVAAAAHKVFPAIPLPLVDEEDADYVKGSAPSMFCGQLIARTLMACGAISEHRASNTYLACDFWDDADNAENADNNADANDFKENDIIQTDNSNKIPWMNGHRIRAKYRILLPETYSLAKAHADVALCESFHL
jgi:hypothetical protein